MNIAILSKGPQLYSTQSLLRAGIRRGHHMRVIDHTRCNLIINPGGLQIIYEGQRLRRIHAIIPRIGTSVTMHGVAVINQLEAMDAFSVAKADALLQSRDKLRCLQKMARFRLPVPKTLIAGVGEDLSELIRHVGGLPVIIKLAEGTHGVGVVLAETFAAAESIIDAFQKMKEKILIQEFIAESKGADVRALVVGGEVVAAMKRQAKEGEFRSNLHRGATSESINLDPVEAEVVKKAVKLLGLDVAGVDLLRSNRGPLLMEVNASPGLEGIETTTGFDIAGKIIEFVERRTEELRNYRANLHTQKRKI